MAKALPSRWYTDPAITEREIHQIFRKTWNYVGPANELTNLGDYITGYVGEIPVVVVRNETGLTALVNVCRHRRHEVMKGRGNAKVMQCGYHAWTYDLTGCLKGAPRTAAEPGFRLEDYPLLPLRVETLGPWVFVNADRDAEPLPAQYGKVLDVIAQQRHRPGQRWSSIRARSGSPTPTGRRCWRTTWNATTARWRIRASARPSTCCRRTTISAAHGWFCSQVGHVRQSALEGRSQVKIYDARGEVEQAQYHLLFPNMTININPGFPNLSIDVWRPNGPNGTKGFSEQYFAPGVTEAFAAGADRVQSPGRRWKTTS